MKRFLRIALVAILAIVLLGGAGFVVWGSTPQGPMPEALTALQSDASVQVQTAPWLSFSPQSRQPTTGFILFPGGHVDARSYAPMARAIAAQGYLVVIPPMPLALAFLGTDKADEIIAAYPTIKHWAIGGHSLGGVAAASFAKGNANRVNGLVLWASYPADWDNLSHSGVHVTSIYASRDGLSTGSKSAASRALLPAETEWVEIMGGNHGQFGWYGIQSGDGTATISREEQTRQIAAATASALARLEHSS